MLHDGYKKLYSTYSFVIIEKGVSLSWGTTQYKVDISIATPRLEHMSYCTQPLFLANGTIVFWNQMQQKICIFTKIVWDSLFFLNYFGKCLNRFL